MKLLLFYTTTLAMLFGALTVLFNAIGVGEAAPPAPMQEVATPVEVEPEEEEEPDPYEGIRHPYLLRDRYYTVSLDTPLFAKQEIGGIADQLLPAGGVFRVARRIDAPDDTLWYQVGVSDGRREFFYYVRAYDLNWTEVERYLPRGRLSQREMAADQMALYEITGPPKFDLNDISSIRERKEERERLMALRNPPVEQQESELEILGETLQSGVHTFNSRGWLSAAMLAGVLTVAVAGFLGMAAWYRVTHRWSSGRDIEAIWSEDGPDMGETENVRQAQPQIEHQDDPYT